MTKLLKTLIPKVEYCSPLWSPIDSKNIKLLESVQENFTRYISDFRELNHQLNMYMCNTNYWDRLKNLKLFSLQRRRERYLIIYLFKIVNGFVPNPGMSFIFNDRTKLMAVTEKLPTKTPAWVQKLHRGSFFTQAAQLYNILPKDLRELPDVGPSQKIIKKFKTKLDNFLQMIPDQPGITGIVESNALIHQAPNFKRNHHKPK